MTKHCSSSSSSSSSCSSSSSSSKSECPPKPCEGLKPSELLCYFGDAVVSIETETLLTTLPDPEDPDAIPQIGVDTFSYFMQGNGFFIKKHYIVCPAHLVLIPPTVLASYNRYPFVVSPPAAPVADPGILPNAMTKVSRILVNVYNVNNKKKSYAYEADLVSVDGAGDVAVLKIDHTKAWNVGSPKIKHCHPYLKFGKSRKSINGETVYGLGTSSSTYKSQRTVLTTQSLVTKPFITHGLLQSNRYVDYLGGNPSEQILVDMQIGVGRSGLPIIDSLGYVIGMIVSNVSQTSDDTALSDGAVSGPSEFFMRCFIKETLKCNSTRFEVIADTQGSYKRFLKGYLGLSGVPMTALEYDTVYGATGGTPYIQTRLDSIGELETTPTNKELEGYKLTAIGGATGPSDIAFGFIPGATASADAIFGYNGDVVFPGSTAAVGGATALPGTLVVLPNSPLLGTLVPQDILTKLNNCSIGSVDHQIAPGLFTWSKRPAEVIEYDYRTFATGYTGATGGTVALASFPPFMDYPWYKVDAFPQVNASVTPSNFSWPYVPDPAFRMAF